MPVGFRIASAWVDIRAEDKGLREQIKAAVEKAARDQDVKIPLKIDSKGLRREVQDALKNATKGQKPTVAIGIKSTGLRKEVSDALKAATDKQKPKIKLGINSTGLRAEVQRALNAATKDQKPTVKLGISAIGLRGEVQRALAEATAGQNGTVSINARVDTDGLTRALADTHPTITPNIDVRGLRQRMMAAIRQINVNDSVHINPNIDGDALANQIRSQIARLRDKYRVRIGADIDTDTFAARLRAAARQVPSDIDIDLNPRINQLQLRAAVGAAAARIRPQINFTGELNTAMTRARLMASLAAAQAGLHITVPVRVDQNQFLLLRNSIGSIEQGFRAIEGPTGRWAHIIAAAAVTIGPAFALANNAIRTTGASLAVMVPMLTSLISLGAAFKIGFEHVGSVISGVFGGSKTAIKDLENNLALLSPEARKFGQELIRLQPAFSQLRIDVQDQLFKNFDQTLDSFTSTTLPVLRRGVASQAQVLHGMAQGIVDVMNKASHLGELDIMFGGLRTAMQPMIAIPGQFTNALIKMSIAAAPLLTRMTTSFGGWAQKMTDKMNTAFYNGTLQASISKAGDTIVNFFRRIANNPEFQKFVDRVKASGPQIADAFAHIAEALMKILNSLAPVTAIFVKVADAAAQFINALPPVLLDALIIKFVLFKAALAITGLVKGLAMAMVALRLSIVALTATGNVRMVGLLGERLAAMGMTATGISRVATSVGILVRSTALLAGLTLAFQTLGASFEGIFGDGRIHANMDKLSKSLVDFSRTGKVTGESARVFGDDMDKIRDAAKQVGDPNAWDRIVHGFKRVGEAIHINGDSWQKSQDTMKTADEALVDLAKNGHADAAAAVFKKMASGATSLEALKKSVPGYTKYVKDAAAAQKLAAVTMGAYGDAAVRVQNDLNLQRQAADGLKQSIEALNDAHRQAAGDQIAMEASIDDATATIKANMKAIGDNSQGLSVNTAKGRENRTALMQLAQSTSAYALSKLQETGSYSKANVIYERGREQFIKLAEAAGQTRVQAEALADQWLRMPDKTVAFKGDMTDITQKLHDAKIKIDGLKQQRKTAVGADKTRLDAEIKAAQAEIDALKQKRAVALDATTTVFDQDIRNAQAKVDALRQKRKVAVGADKTKLDAAIAAAQRKVDGLKQKKATVILVKDLVSRGVANAQQLIDAMHGKTVKITVKINGVKTGVDPDKYYSQGPHKGARYGGIIHRASGGMVQAYLGGGGVSGPGGPTADAIHAMLSDGEFVMRAAAVKKYGLGFFNMINRGMFPKFAAGGAVTGASVSGGVSGASGVKAGVTTGTFTVKDGTGKPVASAVANFKALSTALTQTYNQMQTKTQAFGTQFALKSNSTYAAVGATTNNFSKAQVSALTGASNQSQNVWNSWKAGMTNRTSSAYKSLQGQTSSFQKSHSSSTSKTSSSAQSIWNSWKSGMVSKTQSTYSNLNSATSSFQKQTVSKIGAARDGMGSAWGGLGAKFRPPVSYLVHTVINSGIVGSMNAIMSKLGGGKSIGGISVAGFASGGPIYGPGTKTSDSIPARLSHGEYVIQAKAVDKFGVGFLNSINQGALPHDGGGFKPGFASGGLVNIRMAPGFATGGAVPSADALNSILGDGGDAGAKKMTNYIMDNYVLPLIDSGSGGSAMKAVQRAGVAHIQSNVEKFVKENFGGAGSASAGLRWAKTQYGKPYQWGGNGNPSWDCSGFMSAIESVIRGEKPHRRWATGSFSGATAPSGWKLNASAPFKIGITNAGVGHTAGTIGKENVESSGGAGVHGGASARGWNNAMFGSHYGYVGPNATKKAFGGLIRGVGSGTSDSIPAWLSHGEFVIRSAAVKKLGTGYLSALNSGNIPGFAAGGFTLPNVGKVGTGGIQDAAGISALKGFVTLSQASIDANSAGANIKDEIQTALKAQDSWSTLKTNLYDLQAMIKAAFKGDAETTMLARLSTVTKALTPLQQNLDLVNSKLASATDALDDLKGKFTQLHDSVASNITDYGKVTKIGTYGTSPQVLLDQLTKDSATADKFRDMLVQLKAKGVGADVIGQVAEAGISGGGLATAQTILQMTPEQIQQMNALQAKLVSTADAAGTAAANGMYQAGISAAQGIVEGLKSQQKAIEDQMLAIAVAMEKAIKQALGIKSPSRVMMQVADFTVDGLRNQLVTRTPEVAKAMDSMVSVPATSAPNLGTGTIAGGPNVTYVTIENINVNGTFSLETAKDRKTFAKTIAKDVKEAIRQDDKAHR
jgi:hypothetical protein